MKQSGIEPAPFRLVAQCLNQKYQISFYLLIVELAFDLGSGLRWGKPTFPLFVVSNPSPTPRRSTVFS
jgi:hypothetical protein